MASRVPGWPVNSRIAAYIEVTACPHTNASPSKLSGEALMGDDAYGINRATIVHGARVQE